MPREFARRHRVAEELQRELGVLVATEVKDPRVKLVTITDVDVSPDLKHAKVHVASFDLNRDGALTEAVAGLRSAASFLKRELGRRLHLRVMPDLRFIEDTTERDAQHLDQVIRSAVAEDRRHGDNAPDDASATIDSGDIDAGDAST